MTSTLTPEPLHTVGGELDISVENFLGPEAPPFPPTPSHRNCLYLDTGRSAIYVALSNIIRLGGKRKAWLPRYSCPSVALPFVRLGFQLHFYATGRDLNSPVGLPSKLDGETILFIHYFGKRNRAMQNYLEQMKKRCAFFVIEDCVQALLSSHIGTCDFAVYSYRKFFPQPDGALLSAVFPLTDSEVAPADETFVSRRLIGKIIRSNADSESFLPLFAGAEDTIDHFATPRQMSFLSSYLLARTNGSAIAGRRRDNFFHLIELIKQQAFDTELLHPLFKSLSPEEVPLGLPVVVNPAYRDKLRAFLAGQKIYCPVHWPQAIEDAGLWRDEYQLSRALLTLPLDQRLDDAALCQVVHGLAIFFHQAGVKN